MTDSVEEYYQAEADRIEHESLAADAKARKAEWVRARLAEGMKGVELAELIGVSPQRISKLAGWERP